MKWKEVYDKCNNKKYSAIMDIKQPVVLKSTFGVFLDKYKYVILVGFILLAISSVFIYKFSFQTFLCILAIFFLLTIALVYYNTFKLEFKNDNVYLNIMFNDIKISQNDLANIYLAKQTSNILMFIPLNLYYITIIYSDNNEIKAYSLSTIMTKKEDVLNFFKHFKFKTLKQQKEEDKKENVNDSIKKIIRIFIAIVVLIAIISYLL